MYRGSQLEDNSKHTLRLNFSRKLFYLLICKYSIRTSNAQSPLSNDRNVKKKPSVSFSNFVSLWDHPIKILQSICMHWLLSVLLTNRSFYFLKLCMGSFTYYAQFFSENIMLSFEGVSSKSLCDFKKKIKFTGKISLPGNFRFAFTPSNVDLLCSDNCISISTFNIFTSNGYFRIQKILFINFTRFCL